MVTHALLRDPYVRAFQHLGQFAGRAKFSTWLTPIAVHEALARLQNAKRFEDWDAMNVSKQDKVGAAPLPSDPESKTATAEMNKILEQAIQNCRNSTG